MGSAFRLPMARVADAGDVRWPRPGRAGCSWWRSAPRGGARAGGRRSHAATCLLVGGEGPRPAARRSSAAADAGCCAPDGGRRSNRSTSPWPARWRSTPRRAQREGRAMSGGCSTTSRARRHRPPPAPLAERMRPRTLDEFVGQEALLAPGPAAARGDRARRAAVGHPVGPARHRQDHAGAAHRRGHRRRDFVAVQRRALRHQGNQGGDGRGRTAPRATGRRTIVFVDEIHRFNKAQQDAFLPRVEAGDIVLIGATTENPSFEVNAALLSRSKVFVLQPLDRGRRWSRILQRALADPERGLGRQSPRGRRRGARRARPCTPTATRAAR